MAAGAGRVLGVDVGGTKIAFGWVDIADGSVEGHRRLPTDAGRLGHLILADVVSTALDMGADAESPVGVSLCELVDLDGRPTSAQTVDWRDLDLAGAIRPVISSDVRAGALAEARIGAGRGLGSFLYVTVGTGVSATFSVDGVPWPGARGNALILATGHLDCPCPSCGETTRLQPEEVASGAGMARRFATGGEGSPVGAEEGVIAAADAGDPDAAAIVSRGGRMLGAIVGWAVNLLDPEAVVMGGGLGLATGLYRDAYRESLADHIWSESTRALQVLDAHLGAAAALVGAAIAAAEGKPA